MGLPKVSLPTLMTLVAGTYLPITAPWLRSRLIDDIYFLLSINRQGVDRFKARYYLLLPNCLAYTMLLTVVVVVVSFCSQKFPKVHCVAKVYAVLPVSTVYL